MKIIRKLIVLLLVLSFFVPTAIFAAETDPVDPLPEEPAATEEPAEPEEPSIYDEFLSGIEEGSDLYPIKEFLEGINVEIVLNGEEVPTLIISFVNPDFFGSEMLSEELLAELEATLRERILNYLAYLEEEPEEPVAPVEPEAEEPAEPAVEAEEPAEPEAEEPAEPAVEAEEPVEPVVEEPSLIEIVLVTGLTEEQEAAIIQLAECELVKLFVTEAFDSVKDAFFQAKVELINAMYAYKAIRKTGDLEDVMEALGRLQEARENKDLMELLKDEVEIMKEGIKELLVCDDDEGFSNGPKEESPSIMNKLESEGIGKGLVKEKKEKKVKTNNGKKG